MCSVLHFNFCGHRVRVGTIDSEPWFVAADVCRALCIPIVKSGKPNASVVTAKLPADEKGIHRIDTPEFRTSPWQRMVCVSEFGLYRIIQWSGKAEARAFQDWVDKEVLPESAPTPKAGTA